MKCTYRLLTAALIVVCSAIVIIGCNKDKETTNVENETMETFRPQGEEAIARILDFRQQFEAYQKNPAMKSGATISLAEAIWNIENLFNLTYAKPEDAYSETSEFVFSLYLPIDAQGNVLETDLFCLYEQVKALARTNYANTDYVNKGFLFMTVELGEQIDGYARIDFRGKSGERSDHPIWHYHDTAMYMGPFTTDDNWKYADGLGNCEGNILVSGADKEIQRHLRNYIALIADRPETGKRTVFLNPISIEFDGTDYPNYVFYRTNINQECIDFNNMNRLFQREKRLIFEIIPNELSSNSGYTPIEIQIDGKQEGELYITHKNNLRYAQRLIVGTNIVGEIHDLLND